jgi:hypothetical protein
MEAIFFYDHDKVNGKLDKWWGNFAQPLPPLRMSGPDVKSTQDHAGGGEKPFHTHLYIGLY